MEETYNNFIRPIIIAISFIFWLKGAYRIVDVFIKDTMINNITMVIVSLAIMYVIIGDFTILGNSGRYVPDENKITQKSAIQKNVTKYNKEK
jgi:hypothetical protein